MVESEGGGGVAGDGGGEGEGLGDLTVQVSTVHVTPLVEHMYIHLYSTYVLSNILQPHSQLSRPGMCIICVCSKT